MSTNEERNVAEVSKTISRALNISGVSDVYTLMSKCKTEVEEKMLFSIYNLETHHGGSQAEGTGTKDSDFDMMTVVPEITVCTCTKIPESIKGHMFIFQAASSRPGYGRLQLYRLNDEECKYFKACNGSIKDMLEERNDGLFLSSTKFVSLFVSLPKKLGFKTLMHARHGPCAMSKHKTAFAFHFKKALGEKDYAHGVVCNAWPAEATEWITRERNNGWPGKETIKRISQQSCHAVPVGDTRSEHSLLEWRISFLIGERELVWNFNNTQVQCYILLKIMLKRFIQPLCPEQISTYHLKTIMFWMSEEKAESFWRNENLIWCLEECLEKMLYSVENRALEHYFHRQRNLLAYKFENVNEQREVLEKIREIKMHIISYLLDCIREEWEILSENWHQASENVTEFVKRNTNIEQLNELYVATEKAHNTINMYRILFGICMCTLTYDDDAVAGLQVNQLKALSENIPEGIVRTFYLLGKWFLSIRVGMVYWRYLCTHRESNLFNTYIQKESITMDDAMNLIYDGRLIDAMSGMLYLASAFLCQGDYMKSNRIVKAVLKQGKYLVYPGYCSNMTKIHLTLDGVPIQGPNVRQNDGKTSVGFDVLFSISDVDCVPHPVKFECATADLNKAEGTDYVLFHPCVYAQFLLCIGHFYSGELEQFKTTIQQLAQTVDTIKRGLFRHRALNLLGYCYSLDGNFYHAFQCFRESLQEDDIKQWRNKAALYHICILLLNIIGRPIEEEILYERKTFIDHPYAS